MRGKESWWASGAGGKSPDDGAAPTSEADRAKEEALLRGDPGRPAKLSPESPGEQGRRLRAELGDGMSGATGGAVLLGVVLPLGLPQQPGSGTQVHVQEGELRPGKTRTWAEVKGSM